MKQINEEKMALTDKIKKYAPIVKAIAAGIAVTMGLATADAAYHHTSLWDILTDIPRSVGWDITGLATSVYILAKDAYEKAKCE